MSGWGLYRRVLKETTLSLPFVLAKTCERGNSSTRQYSPSWDQPRLRSESLAPGLAPGQADLSLHDRKPFERIKANVDRCRIERLIHGIRLCTPWIESESPSPLGHKTAKQTDRFRRPLTGNANLVEVQTHDARFTRLAMRSA
jgi:hypothetical protein